MKRFSYILHIIFSPGTALWAIPLLLIVPNVALCITEDMPAAAAIANTALPIGIYIVLMSMSAKCGITTLLMLPLMILAAFQIVLLCLYHGSIIAVDMFLNVVTTNSSEVGELLDNLAGAMLSVILLYLPPIIWGISVIIKHRRTPAGALRIGRIGGTIFSAIGIVALTASYATVPAYSITTDLFPVNVIKNMFTAIDRTGRVNRYLETSSDFRYNASTTHPTDTKEIYVMVIGETSRAGNFQILGYNRKTTPRLAAMTDIVAFDRVLSESNTTHKSVPMLMSPVAANDFDSLYRSKSVITAFKEAGYKTIFLSNQHFNRSFIDFFGQEADSVDFIAERTGENHHDGDLTAAAIDILRQEAAPKLLMVLHTYGSHFCYTDRYPAEEAHFTPDDYSAADADNRDKLINAYDNTIRHADSNIANIIDELRTMTDTHCALIYTSDHGEDIYDDDRGRFLHASPTPTYWQLHVPMIIWTSSGYAQAHPDKVSAIRNHAHHDISSSASFTPTLLDMAGIKYPGFDTSASIASGSYTVPGRIYINDRNEAVPLVHSGMKHQDFEMLDAHGISYHQADDMIAETNLSNQQIVQH